MKTPSCLSFPPYRTEFLDQGSCAEAPAYSCRVCLGIPHRFGRVSSDYGCEATSNVLWSCQRYAKPIRVRRGRGGKRAKNRDRDGGFATMVLRCDRITRRLKVVATPQPLLSWSIYVLLEFTQKPPGKHRKHQSKRIAQMACSKNFLPTVQRLQVRVLYLPPFLFFHKKELSYLIHPKLTLTYLKYYYNLTKAATLMWTAG